ncbi:HAD family hydrolase [Noviherbaspirillum aridicola]|uniref:phosphoglycolate phosphatase n=1 Tax=Noviherbaspirillum aridicola TaxID=2849687 RepID=A0ABQ4Q335_9BURK|nr:HAD family hydrolase [Noviherbaspirillum aridicola]GIZ51441.1 hypothetical protein NCCP691_14550 [Noviherbaspirillum aridicola]
MAIEALILALDGVIFETEEIHLAACNAALGECGLTQRWTLAQYRDAARMHGASRALSALFPALPAARARALQEAAERHVRLQLQARPAARHPGCAALMDEALAHGCKLAIVTDMPAHAASAMLQHAFGNDVNNTFAVVISGARFADAGDNGPHHLAMRTLGAEAEHCAAIDAAVPGLSAAQRAGIWTMAATPYERDVARISGADLWCPRLQELRDLIGKRAGKESGRFVSFSTLRSLKHGQLAQRPVLRRPLRWQASA